MDRRRRQGACDQDTRLELIDAAYAGAADGNWSGLVERLSSLLHGEVALRVSSPDLRQFRTANETFDPDYAASYIQEFAAQDPWRVGLTAAQRDRWARLPVVFTDEIIRRVDSEKTRFYADWLRPQGLSHGARARVRDRLGEHLDLVIARSHRAPEFSEPDRHLLTEILPHLSRAVQIAGKLGALEAQAHGAVAAFEQLGVGVLVVTGDGLICMANAAADRVLKTAAGVTIRGGRLHGAGQVGQKLAEALRQATLTRGPRRGSSFSVTRPASGAPVSISVAPLQESNPLSHAARSALVVMSAPELQNAPSPEPLRMLYDLTPAEARLVSALCGGQTLQGYAASAGTSLTTAKTHLRSVFSKTGERRQADLVLRIKGDTALALSDRPQAPHAP